MASQCTDGNNQKEKKQRQLALNASSARTISEEPSDAKQSESSLYLSNGKGCLQVTNSSEAIPSPPISPNPTPSTSQSITVTAIVPCRCKSWFCPECGDQRGRRIRQKLSERLEQFEGVFGITLTLDPQLYQDAEEAWRDVRKRRLIYWLANKLFKRGLLATTDYFWVIEFQKDTKFPHWHLLLNAKRVPYGEIVEIWSSFRPRSAPPLPFKVTKDNYQELERPAYGSVHFSKPPEDVRKAAYYATKYLTKSPNHGFPDWALDYKGQVQRFNHSRGFFPKKEINKDPTEERPQRPKKTVHKPGCFCEYCRGDEEVNPGEHIFLKGLTTRERIADCGNRSMSLKAQLIIDENQPAKLDGFQYNGMIDMPFSAIKEQLHSIADVEGVVVRELGLDLELLHQQFLYEERLDDDKKERGQDQW